MSLSEKTKERCDELFNMGLHFDGSCYIKDDINFHYLDIQCDTDEQWSDRVNKVKEELKRRKNEK